MTATALRAGKKTASSPPLCCFVVTGFAVQERLRWKWSQSQNSSVKSTSVTNDTATTAVVAQQLLDFLDTHLAHEPDRPAVTADSSATPLAGQHPRGYSVEVHLPVLGGTPAAMEP